MNAQFSAFKNSLPFLKYVVKKLKQLPVIVDFIVMGKGWDLTVSEQEIVHSKIKGKSIKINNNVDGEFYHNPFCQTGDVFDMIEGNMPLL